MTRFVGWSDRAALPRGVTITAEWPGGRHEPPDLYANGWPIGHYVDDWGRRQVDLHEVQDVLAACQQLGPVPPRTCTTCGHDHYRGRACRADQGHPLGIGCWCTRGRGTPLARAAARPAIPALVRAAVIARDGWVCVLCRRHLVRRSNSPRTRGRTLHLDHIVPVSHGGQDTVDNLRVLCATCNVSRGNRPWLDEELAARAIRSRRRELELTP